MGLRLSRLLGKTPLFNVFQHFSGRMGLHAHHEDALHARSTSIQRQRTLVNPSCVQVLGYSISRSRHIRSCRSKTCWSNSLHGRRRGVAGWFEFVRDSVRICSRFLFAIRLQGGSLDLFLYGMITLENA